jgi:5-methylcytosine-specific restriction endonuclease McrA
MVQTAFNQSGKILDRREVLKKVEGLTTRQAQAVVGKPQKQLTLDMIGDDALREKLKRILGKYAHSKMSLEAVINMWADHDLAPAPAPKKLQRDATPARKSEPMKLSESPPASTLPRAPAPASGLSLATNRKRMLAKIDRCSRCGSYHALQVDHIVPRAKGGADDPSNLRVLCRNCNQRAAIRSFGQAKMSEYIPI